MLYLIYGNDWQKARTKAREVLLALRNKKPDATVVDLSEEGISEAKLEELAGSQGLFERKFIVFADRLSEKVSDAEIILGEIPLIAESDNVFVFLEGSLKADILKVFKKYSNQVQNCVTRTSDKT
jgi:DNA polymerase III delta subunit